MENLRLGNPQWLVLARQSRGLTQKELAESISVNQGWLSRVESGLRDIPEDKLLQIAQVLKYPPEFFAQTEPMYLPDLVFRRRQNVPDKTLDKIYARLSIISRALESLLEGVDIRGTSIKQIDLADYNGDIEDIAREVRSSLGFNPGPIQDLTTGIENANAIIMPLDFGTKRIDAVSFCTKRARPLFFISVFSPGDRLRFSLCHELGHIVMHQNEIRPDVEMEADRFAAEFLMPKRYIEPYLYDLTLSKLASLKIQWKVSMAALLKRASDLKTITPNQSQYLWKQMSKYGYRQREPDHLAIPVEAPVLYREIVEVYRKDLEYDISELCKLVRLNKDDLQEAFIDPPQYELANAAVLEAEKIIKESFGQN